MSAYPPPGSSLGRHQPAYQGPVRVLVATPDLALAAALNQAANLMTDRLSIVSQAPAATLIRPILTTIQPEVIVLDGEFQRDLSDEFFNLLAELPAQTIALVLLPPGADWTARLNSFAQVRGNFVKPVEPNALLAQVVQLARSHRAVREQIAPAQMANAHAEFTRAATPRQGQLAICVIAFKKGGVGKTSISENLWWWFCANVGPALLIGFDTPDDIPVDLGLPPTPNMTQFFRQPNDAGLRESIQKFRGQYDVIASPGDDVQAQQWIVDKGPEIIRDLVVRAAFANPGYHAIVMDVPPSYDAYAVRPMQFANRLLLVIEPDFKSILKAVDGILMLSQRAHEPIDRSKIVVVVNKWTPETKLSIPDIEALFRRGLDNWTPPIIARIPYDPLVREMQLDNRLPTETRGDFAEGIATLGTYFSGQAAPKNQRKGLRLPKIKIG
jgi:MinD-like ATPase involved in chromosome partitioning or flagellar assembly